RPKTASFDGMVGLEVSGEEAPDLHARFLGGLGVDAIKVMPARGVVVDLVVELLAFGFQSFDQVLYLEDVDILVVGVGVDEERRGEFLGVEDGRSAAILHDVFADGLTYVVGRGVEGLIAGRLVTHARDEVADGDAGIRDGVSIGVGEDVHQRDEAAVAPADDADALGVEERVILEHPLAGEVDVVHFPAPVVDLFVEAAAVAGAAPIVGGDDGVALVEEFAEDVGVAGIFVGMDALVAEDDQGLLLGAVEILGDEGVGTDDERVAGAWSLGVRDAGGRET